MQWGRLVGWLAGRAFLFQLAFEENLAALIIRTGGQTFSVLTIEVEAEHIKAIRILANPEKLTRV